MSDETETPVEPPQAPAAEPAPPDWFHQIPFDPNKGLDGVLPMELPDGSPDDKPWGQHGTDAGS